MIKVADFGLAESIDPTKEYFRQDQNAIIMLPIKWLALESINDGVFSEKSDVVSINSSIYIFSSILDKTFLTRYSIGSSIEQHLELHVVNFILPPSVPSPPSIFYLILYQWSTENSVNFIVTLISLFLLLQ